MATGINSFVINGSVATQGSGSQVYTLTLNDSYIINSTLEDLQFLSEIISDNFSYVDSIAASSEGFLDMITLSDSTSTNVLPGVIDSYSYSDIVNTNVTTLAQVASSFKFLESLSLVFPKDVTDNYNISDSVQLIKSILDSITDSYNYTPTVSTVVAALNILNESYNYSDLASVAFEELVFSVYNIIDSVSSASEILSIVNDLMEYTDDVQFVNAIVKAISDSYEYSEEIDTFGKFCHVIEELLIYSDPEYLDQVFKTYVMGMPGNRVWNYSNYEVDSMALSKGIVYMASNLGLYRIGTTGDPIITSKVKTMSLFKDDHMLSAIHKIYLGSQTDGVTTLQLSTDEGINVVYQMPNLFNNSDSIPISIGKGIRGRSFQIEIDSKESTKFSLDSLEIHRVKTNRRKR